MRFKTFGKTTDKNSTVSLDQGSFPVLQPKISFLEQLVMKFVQICGFWLGAVIAAVVIGEVFDIQSLKMWGLMLPVIMMIVVGFAVPFIIPFLFLPAFLSYFLCFFAYRPLAMRATGPVYKAMVEGFIFLSPLLGYLIFFLCAEASKIH
jgi:hypothetical protein